MTTKSKKGRDHVITEAEAAALNFEPWAGPVDYKLLPTDEEFVALGFGHLVTCRLALAIMYKTKAKLAEIHGEMDYDTGHAMMNSFIAARDFFQHFITVLDIAEARIICAGSSYLQGAAAADRSLRKIVRDHERNRT